MRLPQRLRSLRLELPRAEGSELMDDPAASGAMLRQSLADLRQVNRFLGGSRVITRQLAALLSRVAERPVRLLDVATGSADIPLQLIAWGRRRGVSFEIVATDNHAATLELALERIGATPSLTVRYADATRLPFPDRSFHFALCSTALHHFSRADALRILRELGRVASCGLIVNDLRRSRLGWFGARLLAATVWRSNPITRHDGPLSVRRAFTPRELRALAFEAGLTRPVVRRHPVFRMSLVALPPAAGS